MVSNQRLTVSVVLRSWSHSMTSGFSRRAGRQTGKDVVAVSFTVAAVSNEGDE
jgi:hypothetical protein